MTEDSIPYGQVAALVSGLVIAIGAQATAIVVLYRTVVRMADQNALRFERATMATEKNTEAVDRLTEELRRDG